MAGDFNSIIQGVVTQGTALQNQVHQTAQDITTGAYNTYTDSLSARIAAAKIQASQDLTNTTGEAFTQTNPSDIHHDNHVHDDDDDKHHNKNSHDNDRHHCRGRDDNHDKHHSWDRPDNKGGKRHEDSRND
jgi:hypothetical protein